MSRNMRGETSRIFNTIGGLILYYQASTTLQEKLPQRNKSRIDSLRGLSIARTLLAPSSGKLPSNQKVKANLLITARNVNLLEIK